MVHFDRLSLRVALLLACAALGAPLHAAGQTVERRLDDLERLVRDLDKSKTALEREVDRLRDQNRELLGQLDEVIDGYNALGERYESLKAGYEKVTGAVDKAKAAIETLDDTVDAYVDGGWEGAAERLFKERQDPIERRLDALEKEVAKVKPMSEVQDQIIKDLGATNKELKRFQEEVKKGDERLAKTLASDPEFAKQLAGTLADSTLVKTLAEKLPADKSFLGNVVRSSDFQKSLAFNLTKDHLKYFTIALLKDDTFQKGVEFHLVKSDRYVKAFSDACVKLPTLTEGLAGNDRFRKRIAEELAKPDVLKPIAEQLAKDDSFFNQLTESSSFTGRLAKSSRFTDALVANSTFTSKLKPKVQK